jgi:hypothetical protein
MLDPWIIEEILKKEREQRRESELVHIELPIERPRDDRPSVTPPREDNQRGVMIIDI